MQAPINRLRTDFTAEIPWFYRRSWPKNGFNFLSHWRKWTYNRPFIVAMGAVR